jgi:hypothetical protein
MYCAWGFAGIKLQTIASRQNMSSNRTEARKEKDYPQES